jgi:hypothetical protein
MLFINIKHQLSKKLHSRWELKHSIGRAMLKPSGDPDSKYHPSRWGVGNVSSLLERLIIFRAPLTLLLRRGHRFFGLA